MDIMDIAIAKAISGGGGGGGGGSLCVTFTYDYQTEEATADKTFAEIASAYESGMYIYGAFDGYILTLTNYFNVSSFNIMAGFMLLIPSITQESITGLDVMAFTISGEDEVTMKMAFVSFDQ